MDVKKQGQARAVLLPINLGKLYYLHGYEQHKNILLDAIDYIFPEANHFIQTNAPERVEVILQQYIQNIPANVNKKMPEGLILHLVNLTGFSGNTYFEPLPVSDLEFKMKTDFEPAKIFALSDNQPIRFTWKNGTLKFALNRLEDFEGVVINKK